MRNRIIIGLAVLAFAAIVAAILLAPAKAQPKRWRLADGTEISLAGVTYGTNHTMRYGNRLVDYLYPVLPRTLQKKFQCRVAMIPGGASRDMAIWLWDNSMPKTPTGGLASWRQADRFQVTTVDEHGMESEPVTTLFSRWMQGSNYLYGCTLPQFPRRSREFRVRIYDVSDSASARIAGEFTVPNRSSTVYPNWTPAALPATLATNGVEVSLTYFQIGLTNTNRFYPGPYSRTATAISRAKFSVTPGSNEWRIGMVSASSATGENHWGSSRNVSETTLRSLLKGPDTFSTTDGLQVEADLRGTCWLEEPAWKLRTELTRATNFPPEELWIIACVKIPDKDEINEPDLKTNMYGAEIEFIGLRNGQPYAAGPTRSAPWSTGDPAVYLKVRGPMTARVGGDSVHLKLVEIRDDQGRKVGFQYRGSSMVPMRTFRTPIFDQTFVLKTREDAKAVDVTLAFTKSIYLEFMAKPTVAKADVTK